MKRQYATPDAEWIKTIPYGLVCDSLVGDIDDFEDLVDYEW